MMFNPETGIAVKLELTHTKKDGFNIAVRRVIGWMTMHVDNSAVSGDENDKFWTTHPSVTVDPENSTGSFWVVRLHHPDEFKALVDNVKAWNVKNSKASKSKVNTLLVSLIEAYV